MATSLFIQVKQKIKDFIHESLMSEDFDHAVKKLKETEAEHNKKYGTQFHVPFQFVGRRHFSTIGPSQVMKEITKLFELIKSENPKVVLEIGTDKGGTLYLWCQAAAEDATIVSIDLSSRRRYSPRRRDLYAKFVKSVHQKLHFLPFSSHEQSTVDKACALFGNKKIDYLFIDGDHTYEGVKQDYIMFSPLVKTGGLIAFHDIKTVRPDCGVREVWEEVTKDMVKENYWEYAENDYGPLGAGIGVIRKV
ncbi:MAG: class I SAM-dependent methyltransferase [Bacteroidetes bacterium]|nr:class I SAM-dependent methyltransferase [Bacteroidota bacterium]